MKKVFVPKFKVKDQLTTDNWVPRAQRAFLVLLGTAIGHAGQLDTQGWTYLMVPSVVLGLALATSSAMLQEKPVK